MVSRILNIVGEVLLKPKLFIPDKSSIEFITPGLDSSVSNNSKHSYNMISSSLEKY